MIWTSYYVDGVKNSCCRFWYQHLPLLLFKGQCWCQHLSLRSYHLLLSSRDLSWNCLGTPKWNVSCFPCFRPAVLICSQLFSVRFEQEQTGVANNNLDTNVCQVPFIGQPMQSNLELRHLQKITWHPFACVFNALTHMIKHPRFDLAQAVVLHGKFFCCLGRYQTEDWIINALMSFIARQDVF